MQLNVIPRTSNKTDYTRNTCFTWYSPEKETKVTYGVEPVVDEMFQVLAHPDLSHELVLVAVHARQLTDVSKHILETIS